MAIKNVKTLGSDDLALSKFQDYVKTWTNQFNVAVLDGIFLEKIKNSSGTLIDIVIGTSTTLVPHGLGRKYQGYWLTDLQGDARVWRDATYTSNPELFLPLKASSSVTIKLWVF